MATCETSEDYYKLAKHLEAHYEDLSALMLSPATANALKKEAPNALLHITDFLSADLLIGRMAVVFVWTIIDESGFSISENPHITDGERTQLRAWRHIRDSATHRSGHGRAKSHRKQFDEIMNGPEPLSSITQWDEDTAITNRSAGLNFIIYMSEVLLNLQKRLLEART